MIVRTGLNFSHIIGQNTLVIGIHVKHISIFILTLLTCFKTHATQFPFKLPPELMTKYGVIAPLCFNRFTELSDKKDSINLKTDSCIQYHQTYNRYALENGFIGYNIDTDQPGMKLPYIFYRYIGKLTRNGKPEYVFLISWSGGGTGSFTELLTMTLDNDILKSSKTIASGDRCNGGIIDALVKNNLILYKTNMTPQSLYEVNNKNVEVNQQALLPDCAVCCIGSFHYADYKLIGIQFNGLLLDTTVNEKKLACFNQLAIKYGAKMKSLLTVKQIMQLQSDIDANCFKK